MPSSYFKFKQFTIHHDQCAMKVGTDGVLLGAWAPVVDCYNVLDIGTGTGLIALQLAQRNGKAHITAIELDHNAAQQAQENVNASPWKTRIEVIEGDFTLYNFKNQKFDLIVSNPPYFTNALRCPSIQRNTARHTDTLSFENLFHYAKKILSPDGIIALIIPAEAEQTIIKAANTNQLYLHHLVRVFTKPGKACRRLLMTFKHSNEASTSEILFIEHENHHQKTEEYIKLTQAFYLDK